MNTRTRIVNNQKQRFIANNDGATLTKCYVLQNLGPAKITVFFQAAAGTEVSYDVRSGDFFELYCCKADVQIAQGETLDSAVVQWQPVP